MFAGQVKIISHSLFRTSAILNYFCLLNSHSNIDKTKFLIANGSLMKIESIADALLEHFAILLTCIKQ